MSRYSWNEITKEDVIEAIKLFDAENPEYPEPRSTFLLYGGKKYPAKHIRGMAYKVHYRDDISKADYSGGQETVRFFERLGFDMQYVHKKVDTHPNIIKDAKIYATEGDTECDKETESYDQKEVTQKQKSKNGSRQVRERITIPAKNVIEQKNALQLLLNKICEGDIVCEKIYPWMKTPEHISGEYVKICNELKYYRGNKDFFKKNVTLRCDFVCESRKLIIEYDERQHFSEARRRSLLSYKDMPLDYDRELWIRACEDIQAKDNQPKNRDEIRAYYDSTRDIEASKHGYKLIRIMHGRYDFGKPEAEAFLREMIGVDSSGVDENCNVYEEKTESEDRIGIKIGLYLQTDDVCNQRSFDKAMKQVKESDIDILVLPEIAYVPFVSDMRSADFLNSDEVSKLQNEALELSKNIGRAIVFCNEDKYGTIMSIYANAYAEEGETTYKDYIKHTMTDFSACEIKNYEEYLKNAFVPIIYKGVSNRSYHLL